MKRILVGAALTLALVACNGGGGGSPDSKGVVRDRRHEGSTYELHLEGVTTHNRTLWWETVSSQVYANCQVGDTWDEDDPDGCS